MPSFRTGRVVDVLAQRPGLQRLRVDLGEGPEPAYALTAITGPVEVGDRVVVNTTAVELGLGTGGWHVVHWDLERDAWSKAGAGHLMKARYTSVQTDADSVEERLGVDLPSTVPGMPVVAAGLHSQVAAVAAAFKAAAPSARLAYVMTDGAALPLALSDLVATLCQKSLLDVTVTCGQAFGGDLEAVSIHSAIAVARHVGEADAAVVAMGPGIVGTGTRLGTSGIEVGLILDATAALGGIPIACLRASFADRRARHQGLSHHSSTALGLACSARALIALPGVGGEEEARLTADLKAEGLSSAHQVERVENCDALAVLAHFEIEVSSMGRPAAADRVLFDCGAAAGALAARILETSRLPGN